MVASKSPSERSDRLHFAQGPRLTQEEEKELLREAVELRRLNTLEREMAMQSSTTPLLSIRAKAAGYGNEIDAYEDAKFKGQMARETLVTRNMGLVHYTVNQILGSKGNRQKLNSLSREDLVQEGAIGLARAVDKWNPAIGGKFSTYAVYWIRAAVLRCIAERDDLLRVPNHVSMAVSQINKAARRLGLQELDINSISNLSTSSWSEAKLAKRLAEEAGLTNRQLTEALKARTRRYTGGYVPFEQWLQKGKDLDSDVSTLEGYSRVTSSSMETENLRDTLSKFLNPKEMEALSWRYGLQESEVNSGGDSESGSLAEPPKKRNYLAEAEQHLFGGTSDVTSYSSVMNTNLPTKGKWGEAMSFKEVGKQMQVSAEYGRRLCHAALNKLRKAADEGRLEPALLF